MNGYISVEGLEHDRLQSRIPLSRVPRIFHSKKISPDISQSEMSGEILVLCKSAAENANVYVCETPRIFINCGHLV